MNTEYPQGFWPLADTESATKRRKNWRKNQWYLEQLQKMPPELPITNGGHRKLNLKWVQVIRYLLLAGISPNKIAEIFRVGIYTIYDIRNKRTWREQAYFPPDILSGTKEGENGKLKKVFQVVQEVDDQGKPVQEWSLWNPDDKVTTEPVFVTSSIDAIWLYLNKVWGKGECGLIDEQGTELEEPTVQNNPISTP